MKQQLRILVAPLDWGIGHATRSVPIIRALRQRGIEVYMASNGRPLRVLERAFPDLPTLKLPPYDVRYPFRFIVLNLLIQLPRILWAIYMEHRLIQRWIAEYGFDGIITDNRLGCYSSRVPTVFITHQLNLDAPGNWLKRFTNEINHWFIRRFDYCWIPDTAGEDNLSGKLSRPSPSDNTRFVGPLSRLSRKDIPEQYDVMMLLSGPEPQRSYLEKALRKQARRLPYRMLLVQGKPEITAAPEEEGNLRIVPFMDEQELSEAIASSGMLVCRSGYSTLMDLAVMGKRALLIPTPGQTEQEYLARYLSDRGMYAWQDQHHLQLDKGITAVLQLSEPADRQAQYEDLLAEALDEFLEKVRGIPDGIPAYRQV